MVYLVLDQVDETVAVLMAMGFVAMTGTLWESVMRDRDEED